MTENRDWTIAGIFEMREVHLGRPKIEIANKFADAYCTLTGEQSRIFQGMLNWAKGGIDELAPPQNRRKCGHSGGVGARLSANSARIYCG